MKGVQCPVCIKKNEKLSQTFHPVWVIFMTKARQFCTVGHASEFLRHWGDMKYD